MARIYIDKQGQEIFDMNRRTTILRIVKIVSPINSFNFMINFHKHESFMEIHYIKSGMVRFTIDNEIYIADNQSIVVVDRNVVHKMEIISEQAETYVCEFSVLHQEKDGTARYVDNIFSSDSPIIRNEEYKEIIWTMIHALYTEAWEKQAGYSRICNDLIQLIIHYIQRISKQPGYPKARVCQTKMEAKKIMDYLDQSYMEDISLQDVSEKFHMHPNSICHLLKKEFNTSPKQYMLERRLGEAQYMMSSTSMSIEKIAEAVGYKNLNHFYRKFNSVYGISPTQWRMVHLYDTLKKPGKE